MTLLLFFRCPPCIGIAPEFVKLSVEHDGVVAFLKVDVDTAEDVAQEYGVSAMPTFLFFKNGEKARKYTLKGPCSIIAIHQCWC